MTFAFCQGQRMAYNFECLPKGYHLAKTYNSTFNNDRELQPKYLTPKCHIFAFSVTIMTLNLNWGHSVWCRFKALWLGYLLTKFHYSNLICVRNIVKKCIKYAFVPNFKRILWPWPAVKVILWHTILNVSPKTTF